MVAYTGVNQSGIVHMYAVIKWSVHRGVHGWGGWVSEVPASLSPPFVVVETATNERTNERMNERTNERTTANERTNERTNGGNDCALAATALLRRFDYTLRRSSDRAIKLVLIHWLCVLIGRGSMTVISVGFRFD